MCRVKGVVPVASVSFPPDPLSYLVTLYLCTATAMKTVVDVLALSGTFQSSTIPYK